MLACRDVRARVMCFVFVCVVDCQLGRACVPASSFMDAEVGLGSDRHADRAPRNGALFDFDVVRDDGWGVPMLPLPPMGGGCGDRDPMVFLKSQQADAAADAALTPLAVTGAAERVQAAPDSLGRMLRRYEIDSASLDIKEKIGEGSFGVVNRAVWRGMQVAVKSLKFGPVSVLLALIARLVCLRALMYALFRAGHVARGGSQGAAGLFAST
jgi:hypothetical protein